MRSMFHTLRGALAGIALAGALVVTPAMVAAQPDTTPEPPAGSTDGVIIVLDDAASREIRAAGSRTRSEGMETLAATPLGEDLVAAGLSATDALVTDSDVMLQVESTTGASDSETLAAASAIDGVAFAQYNYIYEPIDPLPEEDGTLGGELTDTLEPLSADASSMVNDPYASQQYWLDSTNMGEAWELSRTEGDVTIAILDSGCDLDHEDLRDNLLADLAYDAYYDQPLAERAVQYSSIHGTAVASVAAGVANNGIGVAGASYNAQILPVKVYNDTGGGCGSLQLQRAYHKLFEYIESGACPNLRVVNLSVGAHDVGGQHAVIEGISTDRLLQNVISTARDDYGIATVCAGGNGYEGEPCTAGMFPSDYEDCISVTSLTSTGANMRASDYNAAKDISTPGQSIRAAVPATSENANNPYTRASGTSFSSPIVAGTIALMFAADPAASVDDVCEALYETADPIPYNLDDPIDADRAATTGSHGALNAGEAVAYLLDSNPQFTDVTHGMWYTEPIRYVAQLGIINGYNDSEHPGEQKFEPLGVVSRGQLAQILYNYLGDGAQAPAVSMDDVIQGAWYSDAVNWVVDQHYMNGFTQADGTASTFGVEAPLSREQLATTLARVAGAEGDTDLTIFNSLLNHELTSSWAIPQVAWALNNGVINGFATGGGQRDLAPQGTASRAEMAQILTNCIQRGIL